MTEVNRREKNPDPLVISPNPLVTTKLEQLILGS